VLERDPEVVEDLVLAGVGAGFLRPDSDGGYAFVHDKVREAVLVELGGERRRRLHLAIGNALQAEEVTPRLLPDLAYHFVQAGDRQRGVDYALATGEAALTSYAAADALRQFCAALELLSNARDVPRRVGVLLRIGQAATHIGDYREAATRYQAAAAEATRQAKVILLRARGTGSAACAGARRTSRERVLPSSGRSSSSDQERRAKWPRRCSN